MMGPKQYQIATDLKTQHWYSKSSHRKKRESICNYVKLNSTWRSINQLKAQLKHKAKPRKTTCCLGPIKTANYVIHIKWNATLRSLNREADISKTCLTFHSFIRYCCSFNDTIRPVKMIQNVHLIPAKFFKKHSPFRLPTLKTNTSQEIHTQFVLSVCWDSAH